MKAKLRKFSVGIIDDETPARTLLKYLLHKEPDFEIVFESKNGREAVQAIRSQRPDLVLLDIQMPDFDGFEVIRKLENTNLPHVIFVTAYNEFAVKAFDVHAVDYILKPPIPARFAESIERVRRILKSKSQRKSRARYSDLINDIEFYSGQTGENYNESTGRAEYLKQIVVRKKQNISALAIELIEWIESADHYSFVYSKKGKFLVEKSLGLLESLLDPKTFLRIRKNTIINLIEVVRVRIAKFGALEVILNGGQKMKTSRKLSPESRRRLIMRSSPTSE